jgi:glucuronoarabinoxylan endo-1,4-beta-xylanase
MRMARARFCVCGAHLSLLLAASACTQQNRLEPTLATAAERATALPAVVVDTTRRQQSITGFGASSAWSSKVSTDEADFLFSPDQGIGLSLLRMHIAPDGSTTETNIAKVAVAHGVKVWASPWSPPGEWKDNGSETNGGSLLPDYYQAWADRLTGFVVAEKNAGVPLIALSSQNEPNWTATWETCVYTPDQLTTFIRDYLAPAMARDCPDVKLLAPETINWNTLSTYADPLFADPGAEAAIGVVAVHDYGGVPYAYAAPAANGKEFWETEVSYDDQTGIFVALETARQIHQHLVVGGVNAFHYWWLLADQNGNGGLLADGTPTPQAYALGHFSKFIRPGYVRLDVTPEPDSGLSTSAYTDPVSGRIVIVAVNENEDPAELSFKFAGRAPAAIDPWLTTDSVSLSEQTPFAVKSTFSYTLPAQSITTLVSLDELPSPGETGAGGEAGMASAGIGAGGAAGEPSESAGGSFSSPGSGGTGSVRPGHGGTSSSSQGGTQASAGAPNEGGAASDGLDAGIDDDAGADRRVPGRYYACLCRVPSGDHGGGAQVLPLAALVAIAVGRRRARTASATSVRR